MSRQRGYTRSPCRSHCFCRRQPHKFLPIIYGSIRKICNCKLPSLCVRSSSKLTTQSLTKSNCHPEPTVGPYHGHYIRRNWNRRRPGPSNNRHVPQTVPRNQPRPTWFIKTQYPANDQLSLHSEDRFRRPGPNCRGIIPCDRKRPSLWLDYYRKSDWCGCKGRWEVPGFLL